jgi:carboxylesterase
LLEIPRYTYGTTDTGSATWRDWLEQASRELDRRVGPDDGRPLVLGGLCTGAMLAAALVAQRPGRARGLVMLSPIVAYDGWGLPWWYSLRRLAYVLGLSRLFRMRERAPYGVKNERMRALIRTQLQESHLAAVGPDSINLRLVRESERLSRVGCAALASIDVPMCVVHAREDEICRLASVESALRRVPPDRLELHVVENSYHMVTIDNDRADVVRLLERFVRQCASDAGDRRAPRQWAHRLPEHGR